MERHSFYSKTGSFTLPGGVFELSGMTSQERTAEPQRTQRGMREHKEFSVSSPASSAFFVVDLHRNWCQKP